MGLTVATRNDRDFAHFDVAVLNPFKQESVVVLAHFRDSRQALTNVHRHAADKVPLHVRDHGKGIPDEKVR
jgi:hypothetical protein